MGDNVSIKYSEAFKQQVIREYEKGEYSVNELQRRYGIGGNTTVWKWIRGSSYYRGATEPRKVIIMGKDEKTELERYKEKIKKLEKVVNEQRMKVKVLERIWEVAREEYGAEFKKKCLQKLSSEVSKRMGKV